MLFEELRQGSAGWQRRTREDVVKPRLPERLANLLTVHTRRTGLPFLPRHIIFEVALKFCEVRSGLLIFGLLTLGVLASRACVDTEVEHEGYYECGAK